MKIEIISPITSKGKNKGATERGRWQRYRERRWSRRGEDARQLRGPRIQGWLPRVKHELREVSATAATLRDCYHGKAFGWMQAAGKRGHKRDADGAERLQRALDAGFAVEDQCDRGSRHWDG